VWRREGLCNEFDLALWYPTRGQPNQPALDICGRCTVRRQCLAEALDDASLDFGIRGGMTADARQAARKVRDAERAA
jgi:WhiB family redox-sensing transcriptional regulator